MKKLILLMMTVLCLASCGEDANVTGGEQTTDPTPTPSRTTQVYVMGKDVSGTSRAMMRAASTNTKQAHFFIRIDRRIPGYESCPSTNYWPQTSLGYSFLGTGNSGSVDLDYPYWKYAGGSVGQYVYDSTGKAVAEALASTPSIEQILASNQNKKYKFDNLDYSKLKVIWYVAKSGESNGWHVDGVLTDVNTKDVTEIPDIKIDEDKNLDNSKKDEPVESLDKGNVEVNIHEQLHKDWDEIKTSIHIRDLVDEVKVEIPIGQDNMVPSDDFAIRTYDYELNKVYIKGSEYELAGSKPIKVQVAHQSDKIVITVSDINHDYIKKLIEAYGDGITVEVHSYPQYLSKDAIWNKMWNSAANKSNCTVMVKPAAYDSEKIKLSTTRYITVEEE